MTYARLLRYALTFQAQALEAQRHARSDIRRAAMIETSRALCDAAGIPRNTSNVRTAWLALYRPELLLALPGAAQAKSMPIEPPTWLDVVSIFIFFVIVWLLGLIPR